MATSLCAPEELTALSSLFKGNETAATALCDKFAGMDRIKGVEEGLNTFFLTINGALVFVMHAGFAMVSLSAAQQPLQMLMPCSFVAAAVCPHPVDSLLGPGLQQLTRAAVAASLTA